MSLKHYARALTIAGSDSGGGAGIQADLKTFGALGCYGMSAITALTAQNTQGVTAIEALPPTFVEAQLDAVLSDLGADAVKIGMLFGADIAGVVARCLVRYRCTNIVLDPVMVATSGDPLLKPDAVEAIRSQLIPLATVITPNIPEAQVLWGRPIASQADMEAAARDLARLGCRSVLIKGGHFDQARSDDVFYLAAEQRLVTLGAERVATANTHGTGCTLSSAVAAFLARGRGLEAAVAEAKDYLTGALRAGADYRLGHGHGPVHHYYRSWRD